MPMSPNRSAGRLGSCEAVGSRRVVKLQIACCFCFGRFGGIGAGGCASAITFAAKLPAMFARPVEHRERASCQFLGPPPLIHEMMKDLITIKNCDILGLLDIGLLEVLVLSCRILRAGQPATQLNSCHRKTAATESPLSNMASLQVMVS